MAMKLLMKLKYQFFVLERGGAGGACTSSGGSQAPGITVTGLHIGEFWAVKILWILVGFDIERGNLMIPCSI
jgi:hypothetical protein